VTTNPSQSKQLFVQRLDFGEGFGELVGEEGQIGGRVGGLVRIQVSPANRRPARRREQRTCGRAVVAVAAF
jgi:hypothetical protein